MKEIFKVNKQKQNKIKNKLKHNNTINLLWKGFSVKQNKLQIQKKLKYKMMLNKQINYKLN